MGNCNVTIPYAEVLAQLISPKAVRLRRDFSQIILAIKAHALLHREQRFVDDDGRRPCHHDRSEGGRPQTLTERVLSWTTTAPSTVTPPPPMCPPNCGGVMTP